jgi:hypothetical protein
MNESLTSHYKLMNNIDCSGIKFTSILIGGIFSGSLNGQGYNITNLFITKTELENKQHHPRSHTLTFKNNPRLQKVRKFTAKVREIPSI